MQSPMNPSVQELILVAQRVLSAFQQRRVDGRA